MKFEALIRISEPSDAAKAQGKAKGDVVNLKPIGAEWSDDERRGNFRVVEIEVSGSREDDRVAAVMDMFINSGDPAPCQGFPYQDESVMSTLRIEMDSVDPVRMASGGIIKEADGYTRRLAGLRGIDG